MNRHIALAAFLTCLASTAGAQTPAALPDGTAYPDPPCKKPQVNMVRPPTNETGQFDTRTQNDSQALVSYNAKVKAFNRDTAAYNSCMHAYIDKANGDVKIIQDKANADLKQISERANASMKAIQDKIHQAVADADSVATALDRETAKLRSR